MPSNEDMKEMKGVDQNYKRGQEYKFLMDRHEQYSMKNSIKTPQSKGGCQ